MDKKEKLAYDPDVGDLVKEMFCRDVGVVIDTDRRRDHHYLPMELYLNILFTKDGDITLRKWVRAMDCQLVSRGEA